MPPDNLDVFAAAPVREVRERGQPSPFDGILDKARELICERLDEALAVMLDGAADVITALIKETYVREEWRLYEEAREVATKQRETVEQSFREFYLADFNRRCDSARKIGRRFDASAYSLDALELIEKEDMDETLKFNDMANKLRGYCEEELTALDQRIGVLLGDAGLQAKDNPFSPETICDAYKMACRQLDADVNVRRVMLKLFDDHVLDDIRSVYKAVNALLVRNSILPKIRFNVARAQDKAAGAAGGENVDANYGEPGNDAAGGAPQDIFAMLQSLVARNLMPVAPQPAAGAVAPRGVGAQPGIVVPGAVGVTPAAVAGALPQINVAGVHQVGVLGAPQAGVAGGPQSGIADGAAALFAGQIPAGMACAQAAVPGGTIILQGSELLNALTRIQRAEPSPAGDAVAVAPGEPVVVTNVLHEIKTSSVGAGMNQLDTMTLDIIAMLFDTLFDDPKVPNGVKGLIGRLQIPILKVAIADKTFFSTKTHPGRRLLDTVGEVAMRLPADFDNQNPLFERLQTILHELVEGFHDDLEIFSAARDKLHALIAEEDERTELANRAAAKQAEEMEHLALSRRAALHEVQARLQANRLPQAVAGFLAQQWVKLLILLHVKEGSESPAWKDALGLMDQLIWSIEPKRTTEDRRKLAALLPAMVKQVTEGLKTGGVEDEVRVSFFAELMKFHAQAMNCIVQPSPVPAPVVAAPQAQAENGAAVTNAVVAPAAASAPVDDSLDFTAPITVKNPFGEGEVSVENTDLDFTAEAEQGARAKREASIRRALDNLKMGQWVEFRDPDDRAQRRAGKLIFVSPRKTRYVFAVGRGGKEVIQCTRGEISRRFRAGEAFRLDEPPEESFFDRIMGALLGKLKQPVRVPMLAQG